MEVAERYGAKFSQCAVKNKENVNFTVYNILGEKFEVLHSDSFHEIGVLYTHDGLRYFINTEVFEGDLSHHDYVPFVTKNGDILCGYSLMDDEGNLCERRKRNYVG